MSIELLSFKAPCFGTGQNFRPNAPILMLTDAHTENISTSFIIENQQTTNKTSLSMQFF